MATPVRTITPLEAARTLSTSLEALEVPMSAALFDQIADVIEGEGARFELINGRMVEKGMPTEQHGGIAVNIASPAKLYLKANPIGRVGVEVRHKAEGDENNVRMPDVSVRLVSKSEPVVARGSVRGMPEFAVEIESPDDDIEKMREKAQFYLRNGSRLMWLVRPKLKLVEVYRLNHEVEIFEIGAILSGYDVLPGFELPVAEVFDV